MKKASLFMALCIGLMMLASCNKKVEPTISIITGDGYAQQGTELYSGDPITVGFNATGKKLCMFQLTAKCGDDLIYADDDELDNVDSYVYENTFTLEAEGTVTIYAFILDDAGNVANTSFEVICNEKPYTKFLGHYEGSALLTGTLNVEQNGQSTFSNEMNDYDVPVVAQLEPGMAVNEVIGTIIINDQPNDVLGVVEGNTVTFEAINAQFSMTVPVGGFSVSPTLNMTYNIVGTLEDNILKLNGECKGDGVFNIPFVGDGDIDLDANISGSLTKTE